ncbi:MAG: glycoside hydrolase family 57 protein [Candidatus Aenigmarchaeota archaeon]|nr:glycoside hydrolase family 57 protein [Candidatus Aenigmarchaeota archaeon]
MVSVCFYFQVHQPRRVKYFSDMKNPKSIEELEEAIFFDKKNKEVMEKVAGKCYMPANRTMLDQIDLYKGEKKKFKISYSISGIFLDQLEMFGMDELLDSFKDLSKTGCVEFLNETYYHSLSSFYGKGTDRPEFKEQIQMHNKKIKELFKYDAKVFRNTELLFNNSIAKTVEQMGYMGILAEGVERVLINPPYTPEHIYKLKDEESHISVLLRHYKLSDDIAYRFSAKWADAWPLTADKFGNWIKECQGETINLFMDYETFGEHQWEDTGIFDFMKFLPYEVIKQDHMDFATPTEVISRYPQRGIIDVEDLSTNSWADLERDCSAWLGNDMQRYVFDQIKQRGDKVRQANNEKLTAIWRSLQTSDMLYYMCTKYWGDGDVHKYFSPYDTPHQAFENMLGALSCLDRVLP